MRILIVNDHVLEASLLIARILENMEGAEITWAPGYEETPHETGKYRYRGWTDLTLAELLAFDIVIMNMRLSWHDVPDWDGTTLIRWLREQGYAGLILAHAWSDHWADELLASGADDTVKFNMNEQFRSLGNSLSKQKK